MAASRRHGVGLGSLKEYVHGDRRPLRFYRDFTFDFKHAGSSGDTLKPFIAGTIGSSLLQGPTTSNALTPYFGQEPFWQEDRIGYLHNVSLDIMWDPTAVDSDYFSNNYIFLVKIIKQTSATYAAAQERPPWGDSSSILNSSGRIDPAKLTANIHYTLGAGDKASVALNGDYFKVRRGIAWRRRAAWLTVKGGATLGATPLTVGLAESEPHWDYPAGRSFVFVALPRGIALRVTR